MLLVTAWSYLSKKPDSPEEEYKPLAHHHFCSGV